MEGQLTTPVAAPIEVRVFGEEPEKLYDAVTRISSELRAIDRTLAGRVVAARAVSDGSEFVETYRLLTDEYGITARGAFQIAARVHRSGGFVKDAVYLRGLRSVVEYLGDGGRLDTLLVGKIAADHAPVVEELQRRRVLRPAPLRPSYLDHPDAHYRTERLRDNGDLVALAGAR